MGEKEGTNRLTREQWAGRLNGEWHALKDSAVEGFFQLGQSLLQAKTELDHGEWQEMRRDDLHFNPSVSERLMRIGKWQNRHNEQLLPIIGLFPPDYHTLDILSRLHKRLPEVFDRLVADGTICPSLQRNEVSKILRLERVMADEARVLRLVPRPGKYRALVFDPAWDYDWLSLAARAKPGYTMQTLEQLCALNIKQWAEPECHLYVWTTNNFMYEACKLVELWGFQHRTLITGVKAHFGLGSYFRNATEHVLFATLGDTTTRHAAASIPTWFEWPSGLEHSEKPECFYDIVRAASYPPYGEGNQRTPRPDFANLFQEVAEAAE